MPILSSLGQELRTSLGNGPAWYLFETARRTRYSSQRLQQIIKETAAEAGLTKRVHEHLLRHSVATALLNRGIPIEQVQKFLGHTMLDTTQVYAESSTEMMQGSYRRAPSE